MVQRNRHDPGTGAAEDGGCPREELAIRRRFGAAHIKGPIEGGYLVEGFDELDMLITIYNHPYYPAHLERLGYIKDVDWVEYVVEAPAEMPECFTASSR